MSLTFLGCDVHEFPEPSGELVPYYLYLDFSTEMPLYQEVIYTRNSPEAKDNSHHVRYIINAYRTDLTRADARLADTSFVFLRPLTDSLNYTAQLLLPEGNYEFRVWTDYVDPNSTADKYYNTRDFSEIILADRENHSGSNDYRDAFRGLGEGSVINQIYYTDVASTRAVPNTDTITMVRPMGKFKFISTDVKSFVARMVQRMQEKSDVFEAPADIYADSKDAFNSVMQAINIEEYTVVFKYNAFMPCAFNMFTDRPADSWTGISFSGKMFSETDWEITLGYDYIFVNGKETNMSISVEVYDPNKELVASTRPINVPIVRSKLTVVRGDFLSSMAAGGVYIDPGYEGEDYNIEIF